VLEGSGGNIAVLIGPDGKVLIDGGIGASRPQLTKALADLGADPISHLVDDARPALLIAPVNCCRFRVDLLLVLSVTLVVTLIYAFFFVVA
jgi:hypothetical protein